MQTSSDKSMTSAPPSEPGCPQPGQADTPDDTIKLLTEIRDLLDRSERRERQADFSLLRLVGSLLQMLAVVTALWALAALLGDTSADATPRFMFALFLQLAALTALLADRFR